jgi:hypothetical protein
MAYRIRQPTGHLRKAWLLGALFAVLTTAASCGDLPPADAEWVPPSHDNEQDIADIRGEPRDVKETCGNGFLEPGEMCDIAIKAGPGKCVEECHSDDQCVLSLSMGTACGLTCTQQAITSCKSADGCCPTGCDSSNDTDCMPQCGDGLAESGESCDGNDLSGKDCNTLGFDGGQLTCDDACTFDTAGCSNEEPQPEPQPEPYCVRYLTNTISKNGIVRGIYAANVDSKLAGQEYLVEIAATKKINLPLVTAGTCDSLLASCIKDLVEVCGSIDGQPSLTYTNSCILMNEVLTQAGPAGKSSATYITETCI